MKKLFERFLIGTAALFCLCGTAAANPITIAVFGDSLTSGYQLSPEDSYSAKLARKLQEIGYADIDVVNLSVPAETTAQGLDRFSSIQVKHPDIVILELGVNDAMRGIGIGLVNNNLAYIVGKLQQLNIEVLLFGTKAPPNMGVTYVAQYQAIFESLSTKYKIGLVPDIMEGITGNPSLTQADGFHPNAAGIDVMVENTFRAVDGALRAKWNQISEQQYQRSLEPGTIPGQPLPGDVIGPSGEAPQGR